jgi:hypothetical protein
MEGRRLALDTGRMNRAPGHPSRAHPCNCQVPEGKRKVLKFFWTLIITCCMASSSWASATYSGTSGTYNSYATLIYNNTMFLTGSFTLGSRLAGNLTNANITSLVQSFSFSDGASGGLTITQANATGYTFDRVNTDIDGAIISADITVYLGSKSIRTYGGDGVESGTQISNSPNGVAGGFSAVTFTVSGSDEPVSVPTLSEWAMITLAGLMLAGVALHHRRQRRSF